MNYSSLINDYVDGALEASQEDSLFYELANNKSLRGELRQFIDFEKAAKNDSEAFAPPAALTSSIFQRLNIDAAVTAGGAAAATSTGFLAVLKNYSGRIMSVAASAVLSGLMVFLLMNDSNIPSGPDMFPLPSNVSGNELYAVSSAGNIPVIFSNSGPGSVKSIKSTATPPGPIAENNIVPGIIPDQEPANIQELIPSYNNSEGMSAEQYEAASDIVAMSNKLNTADFSLGSGNIQPSFSGVANTVFYEPISADITLFDILHNISVEVNGAYYNYFRDKSVPRSSSPPLENMSIALFYDATDDISIGLEARQEFFYLEYTQFLEDEKLYNIRQNTNYEAIGLVIKYNMFNLMDNLSAYIKGYAGGNKIGVIVRGGLGLEWSPSDFYSVVSSIELSGIRHTSYGDVFYDGKWGLNWGVLFKL